MQEQEMTLKNTKAEILDALNAALKKMEAAEKGKLNPVRTEKERTEKRVVESAKTSVEQNIFSKELNEKFNDLQEAITVEEARLTEIYGAGRELQKLALIIEAGNARLSEIEEEKLLKTEEAKISLEKLRAEYTQKKAELQESHEAVLKKQKLEREREQEDYAAADKKLKLERVREQEEYQYNLKRTRDKENNTWADEKAAREAALAKREELLTAQLAEAEAKAEYVKSLETQSEGIPALLEAERKTAGELTTTNLTREHEYKSALTAKDYENTISRLNDKIVHLEKEVEAVNKSNNNLLAKLDKAYAEMKELATKTVESASGVKIIGSAAERANPQQ